METSFSKNSWKYALLSLDILISVGGVALISFGVVALGGAGSTSGAYIATAVGGLVLTICFLGCCAAIRESYVLSIVYLALTLSGIIVKTICMIVFAAMKDSLLEMTNERVEGLWKEESENPGAMNRIQMQYYCCGRDSPQDYLEEDDDILPSSCCAKNNCSDTANIYKEGCAAAAVNFFDDRSDYLMLTIVALIALEALSLAAAYFLAKAVKNIMLKAERKSVTREMLQ